VGRRAGSRCHVAPGLSAPVPLAARARREAAGDWGGPPGAAESGRGERMSRTLRFGVISDTHGLLRPEVAEVFQGVDGILHAGDVGTLEVLRELSALAPVTAVRGNMDSGDGVCALPWSETLRMGGAWIHLLHDVQCLDVDPVGGGFQAVVSGHSHQPAQGVRGGVLYLNPGSAGPRRFRLPVSVAVLEVSGDRVAARIVILDA